MHPTLMHEIARYQQADLLREAERTRLAREAAKAFDTTAASVPPAGPAPGS